MLSFLQEQGRQHQMADAIRQGHHIHCFSGRPIFSMGLAVRISTENHMNQCIQKIEKIKKSDNFVDLSVSFNILTNNSLSLLLNRSIYLLDSSVFEFFGRVEGKNMPAKVRTEGEITRMDDSLLQKPKALTHKGQGVCLILYAVFEAGDKFQVRKLDWDLKIDFLHDFRLHFSKMLNFDVSYRKRRKKLSKGNRVDLVKLPSNPETCGDTLSDNNCLDGRFFPIDPGFFPISIEDGDPQVEGLSRYEVQFLFNQEELLQVQISLSLFINVCSWKIIQGLSHLFLLLSHL